MLAGGPVQLDRARAAQVEPDDELDRQINRGRYYPIVGDRNATVGKGVAS